MVNVALWQYAHWAFPSDARLLAHPRLRSRRGRDRVGLEYLTGFLVEKALAVDNIFVFVVVFSYLAIPPRYQHRVLFYGILGALVFRSIFIAMGSVLLRYDAVIFFFGGLPDPDRAEDALGGRREARTGAQSDRPR